MRQLKINNAPVETREAPLWWHKLGLSPTASGYGRRIPMVYMVRLNGRWRRVYCCIYGNSGTCYIDGPRDPETGKRTWTIITD